MRTVKATQPARLASLDALRGFIMLVMALDHANAFIAHQHPAPEMWTGPMPVYSNALAFLTRLVTHLAAPGFFFLMGAGIMLFADSRRKLGWTRGAIVRHLVTRGLLLILIQFLIENPAWGFRGITYAGVLYGLGTTMIIGSLLLWLDTGWIVGISLAAILATHAVIPGIIRPYSSVSPWLRLLLVPGQTRDILVYYPTIPWLGLMGWGLVLGRWLLRDRDRAYRRAFIIGLVFLALFAGVRAAKGWGNMLPVPGADWMAFLNVVKYPPSLPFIFLTLGVDLLLLTAFARVEVGRQRWNPLLVFGSSPLFFYIAHLYLYKVIGETFYPRGAELLSMYPVWLAGLAFLYPLCWLFGRFKQHQPLNSLWRFF